MERQTIRLQHWDYSENGAYFVTICTKNRENFFGEIKNGGMELNEMGYRAAKYWQEIPNHFDNAHLDEWVVMPNHIHGIIVIHHPGVSVPVGTRHGASLRGLATPWKYNQFGPMVPKSLSSMMNQFKGTVKRWCNENKYEYFMWQALFYDHFIRNNNDLIRIRKYIRDNPTKWEKDRNNHQNVWM